MKNKSIIVLPFLFVFIFFSCAKSKTTQGEASGELIYQEKNMSFSYSVNIDNILAGDPYLYFLVDKNNALASNYEPDDLIELKNASYRINRTGLFLRKAAAESLETMAASAKTEGLTLLVSSTYRSFNNQTQVYNRHVTNMGRQAADRVSARPGHSQHQLGLAVDFGSITNAFASTPEGIWLLDNASRFGWSLSYPEGLEEITGYSWESWHYRYVGIELAAFIDRYFEGIQQHALEYIESASKN
jgi:D-alanyl-D-alanine carboxypeptidase